MPDVTIIGGGPAGSTAAILLSRAGWDVTLVEQSRFPRDKVCGECLSALGYDVLTRLGLADAFAGLGAVRLDGAAVHAPGGRSLSIQLPRPMWGLSRHALDSLLLETARAAGAAVRQPTRCEWLTGSPRLELTLRDLSTNARTTEHPTHVILADGKAALTADVPEPTGDFGIKAHFVGVDGPRDAIELFGVSGSYGGLAAIEGNRWNAAFSVPSSRLKECRGDLNALFEEMISENVTLQRRLRPATRIGPWLASPLPRFSVRAAGLPNVIPIGNAAAALEPIGGEGMGLAMRSAELTCASLIKHYAGGENPAAPLRRSFNRLWRTRRTACRAAARAASRPVVGNALMALPLPPSTMKFALRLMGKT